MGWRSSRGDHRLFFVDEARLAKLLSQGLPSKNIPELPGLELRGLSSGQSQSAVPPTVGTDGQPRRWNGCNEIAWLPEAAYAFLERSIGPKTANHTGLPRRELGRQSNAYSAYAQKALHSECELIAKTPVGERHDTLTRSTLKIGRFVLFGALDRDECVSRLADAGWRCGLPAREVQQAIEWALAKAEPFTPPELSEIQTSITSTCSESDTHGLSNAPTLDNNTHASYLKKKHVWQVAQPCVSNGKTAQPYVSNGETAQPCVADWMTNW